MITKKLSRKYTDIDSKHTLSFKHLITCVISPHFPCSRCRRPRATLYYAPWRHAARTSSASCPKPTPCLYRRPLTTVSRCAPRVRRGRTDLTPCSTPCSTSAWTTRWGPSSASSSAVSSCRWWWWPPGCSSQRAC